MGWLHVAILLFFQWEGSMIPNGCNTHWPWCVDGPSLDMGNQISNWQRVGSVC